MTWDDVIAHPLFKDVPFKVELNEFGQAVMSPASNRRGRNQSAVAARLLSLAPDGEVITECSIATSKGVKVADVAWGSASFIERHGFETPYSVAPDACVEVVSPSNSDAEIREKTRLYFEAGAREVWLCDEAGNMRFLVRGGAVETSELFPAFPRRV